MTSVLGTSEFGVLAATYAMCSLKLTFYVHCLCHAFICLLYVGVIFALKVLTSSETPPGREFVGAMLVPTRYAAWVELILIHLLVPNASFMGHLAGILAGVIYTSTPVGTIADKFITSLTGMCALLMNVYELQCRDCFSFFLGEFLNSMFRRF
jgi:hypothetical protein